MSRRCSRHATPQMLDRCAVCVHTHWGRLFRNESSKYYIRIVLLLEIIFAGAMSAQNITNADNSEKNFYRRWMVLYYRSEMPEPNWNPGWVSYYIKKKKLWIILFWLFSLKRVVWDLFKSWGCACLVVAASFSILQKKGEFEKKKKQTKIASAFAGRVVIVLQTYRQVSVEKYSLQFTASCSIMLWMSCYIYHKN